MQTVEKPPFFMHAQDEREVIHINYFSAVVRTFAPHELLRYMRLTDLIVTPWQDITPPHPVLARQNFASAGCGGSNPTEWDEALGIS